MSPHEESAFMTNREMIREIYARTKVTEDMIGNMKGDVSVLKSQQKSTENEINSLKNWRNINLTFSGVGSFIATLIGLHK